LVHEAREAVEKPARAAGGFLLADHEALRKIRIGVRRRGAGGVDDGGERATEGGELLQCDEADAGKGGGAERIELRDDVGPRHPLGEMIDGGAVSAGDLLEGERVRGEVGE